MGLIAGLVVAANLELFLFARLVKPDLLFVLCILLAFAGFLEAYLRREAGRDGRWGSRLLWRRWARPCSPRISWARWGRS